MDLLTDRRWVYCSVAARFGRLAGWSKPTYHRPLTYVPYKARELYGPFHRIEAPGGQTTTSLVKQALSGELWGRPINNGGVTPAVKAYNGHLPEGVSGIEFWAFQRPSHPGPRMYWRRAGPFVAIDTSADIARLQIAFVKVTQDLHP